MRIIAGKNRGTKLSTLDGDKTRPTLDRVKENLFNILQKHTKDAIVLDLFGGSGALALESLSRGANFAYICEKNIKAFNIIKENIKKTRNEDNTKIFLGDALNTLDLISDDLKKIKTKTKTGIETETENEKTLKKIDLIFLDPPYNYLLKDVQEILNKIKKLNILSEDGIIVFETEDEIDSNFEFLNFEIIDKRKYGRPILIFLKQRGI